MYYEMEQSSNPDFYNVVVHLVYNNNMIEETVAIKKIWKKPVAKEVEDII